jgi:hypothetical protein
MTERLELRRESRGEPVWSSLKMVEILKRRNGETGKRRNGEKGLEDEWTKGGGDENDFGDVWTKRME